MIAELKKSMNLFVAILYFPLVIMLLGQEVAIAQSSNTVTKLRINDHSEKEKVVFLFFGDQGTATSKQYKTGAAMHRVCQKRSCDFALVAGDNIYPKGVSNASQLRKFQQHFEQPYKIFGRFDFWMVLGNHDHFSGNPEAEVAYSEKSDRWRMPDRHYFVPQLPSWLNIYAIDTFPIYKNREQNFQREELAQAQKFLCSRRGWKFLLGHRPIYGAISGQQKSMNAALIPIIKTCGVQLYLSGHEHLLEHVSTNDYNQLISGAASSVYDTKPTKRVNGVAYHFVDARLGFAVAEVTETSLYVEFYNKRGKVIYHWLKHIKKNMDK